MTRTHKHGDLTIVTTNTYPPLPWRTEDWHAWVDDWGADCSPIGAGRTEQEAIDDLLERLSEDA